MKNDVTANYFERDRSRWWSALWGRVVDHSGARRRRRALAKLEAAVNRYAIAHGWRT